MSAKQPIPPPANQAKPEPPPAPPRKRNDGGACDHKFIQMQGSSGYYKAHPPDSDRHQHVLGGTAYDQSISYARLFCERCGETKEVVCRDYRKEGR